MNKLALITGASSGFGHGLIEPLIRAGFDVIATCRNANDRPELFSELKARYPGRLFVQSLDVLASKEREAIAAYLVASHNGKLDCLINNAGYGVFGALEDMSEEQIAHQMDVNFNGLVFLTRKLLPYIRAARGRIINISSICGYSGFPMTAMYCASKFAIEGFSESLYYELMPFGVKVALVEPGTFDTDFSKNLEVGEHSKDINSPYFKQSANYFSLRKRWTSGSRKPITPVINATVRLATKSRIPFRIRCGKDAQGLYWCLRLLPAPIYRFFYAQIYQRLQNG